MFLSFATSSIDQVLLQPSQTFNCSFQRNQPHKYPTLNLQRPDPLMYRAYVRNLKVGKISFQIFLIIYVTLGSQAKILFWQFIVQLFSLVQRILRVK